MATAPGMRYHPAFQPMGTNVNFARVEAEGVLRVRTYERGVEDETLSCGTGAVACGIYAWERLGWKGPVVVKYPGGTLEVDRDAREGVVFLTGPVMPVFQGRFQVEAFQSDEAQLA